MIALGPSQPDRPFHGLWSLWDMIKDVRVGELISNLHSLVSLTGLSLVRDASYRASVIDGVEEHLGALLPHFENLGLSVPTQYVRDALKSIELSPHTMDFQKIERITNMIVRAAEIECTNRIFFELDQRVKKYYDGANLFGDNFSEKFPVSVYELDEAGKCFALSRATGAVFHLMRLMEIAIRAIARCLAIPDPVKPADRNWGKILERINDAIKEKTKIGWRLPDDKALFESAYGSLDAVRVAWRNPTMHVENKYTEDEAEHVFIAVRGFMTKLASRCDESGEPKA